MPPWSWGDQTPTLGTFETMQSKPFERLNNMATKPVTPKPRSGGGGFTAYITLKNGRRIYASEYGLKAFPIGSKPRKPKR